VTSSVRGKHTPGWSGTIAATPGLASRTRPHHGLHTQAFDATVKAKTLIADQGQAALELDFIGTHTGDFLGMAATGKPVNVPYCVVYDVPGDKITALRVYMPMELFSQQLGGA
jgi:predicted ester cyclase